MKFPDLKESTAVLAKYVKNKALRQHCRLVALAMEAYAESLGEDKELWYQTGLLHDLDWEMYPDEHPKRAVEEILINYPAELTAAISASAV